MLWVLLFSSEEFQREAKILEPQLGFVETWFLVLDGFLLALSLILAYIP